MVDIYAFLLYINNWLKEYKVILTIENVQSLKILVNLI